MRDSRHWIEFLTKFKTKFKKFIYTNIDPIISLQFHTTNMKLSLRNSLKWKFT